VDFLTDSVIDLARSVRAGELSARDLVGHALTTIDRLNPSIGAFLALDPETAMAEAAALDQRQARGDDVGPLAGIPLGVKDLEDAAGLPTSNGSVAMPGAERATVDSVLVARLRRAGAIVVGKTNTPEHGWTAQTFNARFETTRNPWNVSRTPGGSSGGSAAAIASGMVPLATGSDGGGSLRIPSALCGLSGFKPSIGRVPGGGPQWPGWPHLSCKGPMAWRTRDLVAALDAVVGPEPTDLRSLPSPVSPWLESVGPVGTVPAPTRIVWSPTLGYASVDSEILDICRRAIERLAGLGATVEERADIFPTDPARAWLTQVTAYDVRTFESIRDTAAWQTVTPELRDQIEALERHLTVAGLVRAIDAAHVFNLRLVEVFAHADLLITPTVGGQTPVCGRPGTIDGVEDPRWVSFTYPFNMTGSPAGTVCVGRTADGMPVGLQLIGPQHGDVSVLVAMAALEDAIGFDDRPVL